MTAVNCFSTLASDWKKTRSHPEMVSDMSRVNLNF